MKVRHPNASSIISIIIGFKSYIVAVVQKRRKSIRGNYTGDNKNCPKLNPCM